MTESKGKRAIVVLSLSAVGLLLGIIILCIAFSVSISQLRSSVNDLEERLDSTPEALTGQEVLTTLQELNEILNTSIQQLEEAVSQDLASSLGTAVEQLEEQYANLSRYVIPAASCSDIPLTSPSGYYSVLNAGNVAIDMFCEMGTTTCGLSSGGWMRAAYLNMTNSNQKCPTNLAESADTSLRVCTPIDKSGTCASVIFSLSNFSYSKVCGRIRGYQVGSTDSFGYSGTNTVRVQSLNGNFVDGVVLTHGNGTRRQHIWTFAAAFEEEVGSVTGFNCECTNIAMDDLVASVPSFVGEHYFCDTGVRTAVSGREFFIADPLWDGAGCGENNLCCVTNNPPWFHRDLPSVTTDDIEMRVCRDEDSANEDVAIDLVEIYVQ